MFSSLAMQARGGRSMVFELGKGEVNHVFEALVFSVQRQAWQVCVCVCVC